jgi:hypothetical protein
MRFIVAMEEMEILRTSIRPPHIINFFVSGKTLKEFIDLDYGAEGDNVRFVTGIIVPSFSVAVIVPVIANGRHLHTSRC